jgi:hypothetical protein
MSSQLRALAALSPTGKSPRTHWIVGLLNCSLTITHYVPPPSDCIYALRLPHFHALVLLRGSGPFHSQMVSLALCFLPLPRFGVEVY